MIAFDPATDFTIQPWLKETHVAKQMGLLDVVIGSTVDWTSAALDDVIRFYDTECHVVNEVWDTALNKWVMLDITGNTYWVDAKRTPLSVLEIRQKCAMNEFCTPLDAGTYFDGKYRDVIDLEQIRDKDPGAFLYVLKNLAWIRYCSTYSAGGTNASYALYPKGMEQRGEPAVSRESCERSPVR